MTRMVIPIVGLATLAAVFNPALRAEPLKVNAIRFWTYEETTRIAVEVSGEFQYHSERLHNPERIFFDIRNAKPSLSKKPTITQVDDKLAEIRIERPKLGLHGRPDC